MILGGSYGSLFDAWLCRRMPMAPGAVFRRLDGRSKEKANGSPPGVQETQRSDSQGSGRRGCRDNVANRVSREHDWSDRVFILGRFLPAQNGLGGRENYARDGRPVPAPGTSQQGGSGREVALVDPVGRVGAAGCPQVHRGSGLRLKKRRPKPPFHARLFRYSRAITSPAQSSATASSQCCHWWFPRTRA